MPHSQDDDRNAPVDGDDARSRPFTAASAVRDHERSVTPPVCGDLDDAEGTVDALNQDDEEEIDALRDEIERFFQQEINRQDAIPTPSEVANDEQPILRCLPQQLAVLGEDPIVVPMAVVLDASEIYHVIPFQDGMYRGQVRRMEISLSEVSSNDPDATATTLAVDDDDRQGAWVPHGIGVWTNPVDGSTRCGQWIYGVQSVLGTQQHRGVFLYEGEWREHQPWGYGVGTFANGRVFTGCWARGRPDGLGTWRTVITATSSHVDTTFGRFRGTQCVQEALGSPSTAAVHVAEQQVQPQYVDQPSRGLLLICEKVDAWCMNTFRDVVIHWRLVCCQQAVERAERARALAMIEWQSAQVAEQKAISDHHARCVDARKRDDADIVQLAAQGRAKHARVLHVRQYHQQRCETSEFQCTLARCCVETQQNAIELMQNELTAVTALINEAKQAQEDCRTSSHRLQVIKRQIENVSVRINDIRLRNEEQQRLRLISSSNRKNSNKSRGGLMSRSSLSLSDPKTPGLIDRPHSALYQGTNQESSEIAVIHADFVCDVLGCTCGIPRDVFMRAGAALNGDS